MVGRAIDVKIWIQLGPQFRAGRSMGSDLSTYDFLKAFFFFLVGLTP